MSRVAGVDGFGGMSSLGDWRPGVCMKHRPLSGVTDRSVLTCVPPARYPSVLEGPNGRLHVAYTYLRQTIQYMVLDEDWVMREQPRRGESPPEATRRGRRSRPGLYRVVPSFELAIWQAIYHSKWLFGRFWGLINR
jgi:hypothetical protein